MLRFTINPPLMFLSTSGAVDQHERRANLGSTCRSMISSPSGIGSPAGSDGPPVRMPPFSRRRIRASTHCFTVISMLGRRSSGKLGGVRAHDGRYSEQQHEVHLRARQLFFFCSFQIRTRRGKQRKAHTNRLCIAISTYKSYQGIRYQGTYVFRADEVTGVRVGVCSVMV